MRPVNPGHPVPNGFHDSGRFWPACDYPRTSKRVVRANGIDFWVEEEGEGRPLVLLHGGPGVDHRYFHPAMSALAADRRLVYYDMRGCYMSSEPPDKTDYGFAQYVRDLEALRQALDLDSFDLFGHSYGGWVALHYAVEHPAAVGGLVICSTPLGVEEAELERIVAEHPVSKKLAQATTKEEREALYFEFYYHRPPDEESRKYTQLVDQAFATTKNKQMLKAFVDPEGHDDGGLLARLQSPALVLCGLHDHLPADQVRDVVLRRAGARFELFTESAHEPFVDEPARFKQVVAGFLEEVAK